ncbi:MAG: hypothetical protein GX638_06095 [Crenarchaeota archaeon]|nr:hypothetical protein [Thermoproteota archaeon]
MKSNRIMIVGIIATMIAMIGIFYTCQKDADKTDSFENGKVVNTKNRKSMGNHEQPTQTVNINVTINVENVDYSVEGTAEVGYFDGRIYECDVIFDIFVLDSDIIEPYIMQLEFILNPQYEDLLVVVPSDLSGYTVIVQGNPIDQNYIFITGTGNNITYQTINDLWTSLATKCYLTKSINSEYVMNLINSTGINLYELAQSQFLLDYLDEIDAFGAYFRDGIQNNTISMLEFDSLIQVITLLPMWEDDPDENDPIFREKYHNYCAAMEHLSHLFFGNNFNHTEIFDGVTYEIAMDRMNAMGDSYDIFQQQLLINYPEFPNLPEYIQENIITVVLIMAMGPCEDERDAKLDAEMDRWIAEYNKCMNKKKYSKCVHKAAMKHEAIVAEIIDAYNDCIKKND